MVNDLAPEARADPMVAIVDDDEAILGALARLVRTLGYSTCTFQTAEALLHELDSGIDVACVLTDVQMPGMNGLELARRLRLLDPGLPVMVMTAYPSLASRELALAAGALEYFPKPLDDALLESWLNRAFGEPPER
jgi:FixJ family two-component response regulator